ncbi:hypothetical protein [Henriciella aquimarina]|nr:hypothetical protein [Henriciella aquimarina]
MLVAVTADTGDVASLTAAAIMGVRPPDFLDPPAHDPNDKTVSAE